VSGFSALLPSGERSPFETRRRLLARLRESEVDLEFVAAEAGDRWMSEAIQRQHERIHAERGLAVYSDMMAVLTSQHYPPRLARRLWRALLRHQRAMATALGRAVDVTVAALDYLNQNDALGGRALVLCPAEELSDVAKVAITDGLTGLFDRATFDARLEAELDHAQQAGRPLGVVLLDVDHFKELNDTHGHARGDEVLRALADVLQRGIRQDDTAARYGGEEFALLLPDADQERAWTLGDRVRRSVARHFAGAGDVTVSVGATSSELEACATPAGLLAAADSALYRAKRSGRNQTSRFSARALRKVGA